MPELRDRQVFNPTKDDPVMWVVFQTGSSLVGEFFNAGYYRECLKMAGSMSSQHRIALTAIYSMRQSTTVNLETMIAKLEDISRWAASEQSDDYHTVNSHVFITLWAAHEAGIENIIAAIIQNSLDASKIAASKFKEGRFNVSLFPWSDETCLEIAQKLDVKAKEATINGEVNISERIQTLFSWFNINIQIEVEKANLYNEASTIRNIILHRYGRINLQNAKDFPHLTPWCGKVLPISSERLSNYYNAIIAMHVTLMLELSQIFGKHKKM